MLIGKPLSIDTPTSAKQAQKQSGLGVKDNGYAGAQHCGPHLPTVVLLPINQLGTGIQYGVPYQLCSILVIMEGTAIHIFIW